MVHISPSLVIIRISFGHFFWNVPILFVSQRVANAHSTDLGEGGHEFSEHQRRAHLVRVVTGFVIVDILSAIAGRADVVRVTANLFEIALLSCFAAIVLSVIRKLAARAAVPPVIATPFGLHQRSLAIADGVDGRRCHSNRSAAKVKKKLKQPKN